MPRSGSFPTKEEKHTTLESENYLTGQSISSYVEKKGFTALPFKTYSRIYSDAYALTASLRYIYTFIVRILTSQLL